MSCSLYAMRVASKNNPTANGHCLLCLYCCMVYLACSSGLNLISTNWGISSSIAAPPLPQWLILEEPEKRLGKKMDKVANGEAHRQEVGVISSGSYQNHFLYDLSDAKRERKRDRKEMRMSETFWKEKKKLVPTSVSAWNMVVKTESNKPPVPLIS